MENDNVVDLNEEQLKKAAEETVQMNKNITAWAEKQGAGVIRQMELKRMGNVLSPQWGFIKKGWLGGFVSGVHTGFQLGYKTANKLSTNILQKSSAVLQGTEREAIAESNVQLLKMLETAIQEAADIGINLEIGHVEENRKLSDIVNRLYAEFATPMPESLAQAAEAAGQERLPGVINEKH